MKKLKNYRFHQITLNQSVRRGLLGDDVVDAIEGNS